MTLSLHLEKVLVGQWSNQDLSSFCAEHPVIRRTSDCQSFVTLARHLKAPPPSQNVISWALEQRYGIGTSRELSTRVQRRSSVSGSVRWRWGSGAAAGSPDPNWERELSLCSPPRSRLPQIRGLHTASDCSGPLSPPHTHLEPDRVRLNRNTFFIQSLQLIINVWQMNTWGGDLQQPLILPTNRAAGLIMEEVR